MAGPVINVVVPVHDHARWVGGALQSILLQDYPHHLLRVVVVDDGSTDGSAEVVRKLLSRQPDGEFTLGDIPARLVLRDAAGGPSLARNTGLREAGLRPDELYAFLDSDDQYHPHKLSRSAVFFQRPAVGVVYSDFTTVNEDGLRLRQYKPAYTRVRLLRECIVNCDSVVSGKALLDVGLFDESLRVAEDYNLWLRISKRYLMVHIPESLVDIRVGRHSSSSTVAPEVWQENYRRAVSV